jgi:acetyl esterase
MRRQIFLPFLFTTFIQLAFAQESTIQQVKLVYKVVDGKELKVDMFYSDASQALDNSTAIALFHGGGWVFGDPSEFYGACRRYASLGYITFSFRYRLSRNEDGSYPHPDISPIESVKDARSAIRWLRANADSLNVDPDKIVVGGQSAGGQLALSTALLDTINEETDNLDISPNPNALLLFSSNVNTLEPWIDNLLGDRNGEIWSISPYHNLKKSMPPAIAFHGEEDDQVLPYIVRMFKVKMEELGNYYDLHWYPGRKHYLGEGNDRYATYFDEEILELTDEFLDKFGF